jgi:hypothetical protein
VQGNLGGRFRHDVAVGADSLLFCATAKNHVFCREYVDAPRLRGAFQCDVEENWKDRPARIGAADAEVQLSVG